MSWDIVVLLGGGEAKKGGGGGEGFNEGCSRVTNRKRLFLFLPHASFALSLGVINIGLAAWIGDHELALHAVLPILIPPNGRIGGYV